MKCKKLCPANAILGQNWYSGIDVDTFYNAELCRKTIKGFINKGIKKAICGICIANCPYTQQYIRKHVTCRCT